MRHTTPLVPQIYGAIKALKNPTLEQIADFIDAPLVYEVAYTCIRLSRIGNIRNESPRNLPATYSLQNERNLPEDYVLDRLEKMVEGDFFTRNDVRNLGWFDNYGYSEPLNINSALTTLKRKGFIKSRARNEFSISNGKKVTRLEQLTEVINTQKNVILAIEKQLSEATRKLSEARDELAEIVARKLVDETLERQST